MKKFIHKGDFYLVGGPHGTDMIPADVVGDIGIARGQSICIDDETNLWVPAINALMDYTENGDQITEIEFTSGFYGRYSMPGYTDCTDWTWGKTKKEVSEELENLYGKED